jgi:hypothetical protein
VSSQKNYKNFMSEKRIKGIYYEDSLPTKITLKFQLLINESSYWEKLMLQLSNELNENNLEEYIIKEAIPKLYFGCTVKYNTNVFARLTFMELVDIDEYMTIEKVLTSSVNISNNTYENIEKLVKALWRFNVSHNELSICNILIGVTKATKEKVKLLDYGLAQMFKLPIEIIDRYKEFFKNNSEKQEQQGSNVEKLKELCKSIKNKIRTTTYSL